MFVQNTFNGFLCILQYSKVDNIVNIYHNNCFLTSIKAALDFTVFLTRI